MKYIEERCKNCSWYDPDLLGSGKDCLRSFPRIATKKTCKLRIYKKAPWKDAFSPKRKLLGDLPLNYFEQKEYHKMDEKERKDALKALLNQQVKKAEKKGSEAIVGYVDELPIEYQTIIQRPTGFPLIDHWSNGGFPSGGQITISGEPSVGKTSFALMMAGQYQKTGLNVLFVNFEAVLDKYWAAKLGVDTSTLFLWEGPVLEDGLNAIEEATKEGLVDLVIIDSLDTAVPRGELHKKGSSGKPGATRDVDDDTIALKARTMSQWYRRIAFHFRKNNTTLIMLGQHRIAMSGVMAYQAMSGGNARKYADLLYLKLARIKHSPTDQFLQIGDKSAAFKLKITVAKSKYGGLRETETLETYFFFDKGFNTEFEYVTMAIEGDLENSPLVKVSTMSSKFTDSEGNEHSISGAKPATVYVKMQDEGLLEDFLLQVENNSINK